MEPCETCGSGDGGDPGSGGTSSQSNVVMSDPFRLGGPINLGAGGQAVIRGREYGGRYNGVLYVKPGVGHNFADALVITCAPPVPPMPPPTGTIPKSANPGGFGYMFREESFAGARDGWKYSVASIVNSFGFAPYLAVLSFVLVNNQTGINSLDTVWGGTNPVNLAGHNTSLRRIW